MNKGLVGMIMVAAGFVLRSQTMIVVIPEAIILLGWTLWCLEAFYPKQKKGQRRVPAPQNGAPHIHYHADQHLHLHGEQRTSLTDRNGYYY